MEPGLAIFIKIIDMSVAILDDTQTRMDFYTTEFLSFASADKISHLLSETKEDNKNDSVEHSFDRIGLRHLYHKLALLLHPDKGGSKEEMAEVTKKYIKSDLIGLIVIARRLNVNLSSIKPRDFPLIQHNLSEITNLIKTLRTSHIWQYSKKLPKDRETYAKSFWSKQN